MATTLIERAAHARHRQLVHDLAADLRRARLEAGVSQRALAVAAGVDHGDLSRIEAGQKVPSLALLTALATALGMEASVKLFPTVGPRIHDRVSAPVTEALLGIANPRWSLRLEVFVLTPAKGVIDVVFSERRGSDVIATEIQGQLRRVEQQLRWAGQKADSLPVGGGLAVDARAIPCLAPAGAAVHDRDPRACPQLAGAVPLRLSHGRGGRLPRPDDG